MKPTRVSTVKNTLFQVTETMYGHNSMINVKINRRIKLTTLTNEPSYILIEGCYTGPGNKKKVWKPLYSRSYPNIDLEHVKKFLKTIINDDEPMEIFSYFKEAPVE